MKTTLIAKINPIVEMTSPILLQCKDGECGGCPRDTGKMLWIPKLWQVGEDKTFNFQYNFFNKSAESESPIKFNTLESDSEFGNKPTKQYVIDTPAIEPNPPLSPSQMRLGDTLQYTFGVNASQSVGAWVFFRQPNPAINNVHDALCFEYNHEKRLITFRSF
jgi:hypothetical protein